MTSPGRPNITIGMTASLTGRYSHPDSQALIGAQAWIEDTNRSGGIWLKQQDKRLPVSLVHYDDQSDVGRCEILTERLLVEDQVDILMGPYSSGLALRAAEVAERHRTVLWNHGGASETVYQRGYQWVVGILTPPRRYFEGVIDMAHACDESATDMVIVHSTAGAFPKDVASGAEAHGGARGFSVHTFPYVAGTRDFRPLLRLMEDVQPDLILAVGRIEDDILFAQQYVQSGLSIENVGLIAAPLALFKETLGESSSLFIGPSQWEPSVESSPDYGRTPVEMLTNLKSRRPSGVDYPMAQAYAGCLVAQWCAEEAGSLDIEAMRRVANTADFTTFYGRFNIDTDTGRQVGHMMPVIRWTVDGEKEVVWPPSMKSPDI